MMIDENCTEHRHKYRAANTVVTTVLLGTVLILLALILASMSRAGTAILPVLLALTPAMLIIAMSVKWSAWRRSTLFVGPMLLSVYPLGQTADTGNSSQVWRSAWMIVGLTATLVGVYMLMDRRKDT